MFLFSVLLNILPIFAPDTLVSASVTADRGVVASRTDTVKLSTALSVSDALQNVTGITLGDYGGYSGLKTVSLRGLGSTHTVIYLDGVRMGNLSSGQSDLGIFDQGLFSSAVVDYAQNSLSLATARPTFDFSPRISGTASLRAGSFGSWNPGAKVNVRISDRICASATLNAISSKGDYPYGEGSALRENNDLKRLNSAVDFWGSTRGGEWHAKAFYHDSDRGTPGSVSYPSTERQTDRNFFIQAVLHQKITDRYSLSASAKGGFDKMLYLSERGDSDYSQSEFQFNSSQKYAANRWLDLSLSLDIQYDALKATVYTMPGYDLSRTGLFAGASAEFHSKGFRAVVTMELSNYSDKGEDSRTVLCPSVDLRKSILPGLNAVAFARRSYRMPTFNELYYPGFGNTSLKAEDAILSDIGLEYNKGLGRQWSINAKVDGFFNRLKDKIVTSPTEDPNIWLPFNVGIAQMAGADILAAVKYASRDGFRAGVSARYSFNHAVDKTPDSYTYDQQLPFIGRHNASVSADASLKGWQAVLSWALHAGRYGSYTEMPNYNTLDLSLCKDFKVLDRMILGLKIHARNLADCRYELADGYPMPGRGLLGEINVKF